MKTKFVEATIPRKQSKSWTLLCSAMLCLAQLYSDFDSSFNKGGSQGRTIKSTYEKGEGVGVVNHDARAAKCTQTG